MMGVGFGGREVAEDGDGACGFEGFWVFEEFVDEYAHVPRVDHVDVN